MPQGYRYQVTLEDYDDDRAGELKLYLKTLHATAGQDVLRGHLESARAGSHPVVYETNSQTDARRIAHMLASKGGAPDILGLE